MSESPPLKDLSKVHVWF